MALRHSAPRLKSFESTPYLRTHATERRGNGRVQILERSRPSRQLLDLGNRFQIKPKVNWNLFRINLG
ncbi:hypothetical protein KFK09_013940 [Dendrobium nobile]|uniref:Uncharacterized protein n=1 Tax=Dendrobium nobile TaxID=94219 RepID=A0A8T3BB48_DENNO|nr:hypothetical protein KFK09_013940 [Dendrobium nobile]